MNFFDAVSSVVGYAKKARGMVVIGDLFDYCDHHGVKIDRSFSDMGLRVLVDGVKQEEVAAFSVVNSSSISYKKDDNGNHVLLKSHIDAIIDTVETVGHLQVYVGDDLVVEVKG